MVSKGVLIAIGAVAAAGAALIVALVRRAEPEVEVATSMVTTVDPTGTYAPGATVGFRGVLRDAAMVGIPNRMVSLAGQITGVSAVTDSAGGWDLSFVAPTIARTYSVYGYYGGGA